jgi:hypothetical protein
MSFISACGLRVAHLFTVFVVLLFVFTFRVPCCDVHYHYPAEESYSVADTKTVQSLLHEINILCFRYQYEYVERKRLYSEPPKTDTSENRLISLAPDVVGFQRFHCIGYTSTCAVFELVVIGTDCT